MDRRRNGGRGQAPARRGHRAAAAEGAAIGRWLYADAPAERLYRDIDLLVHPAEVERAVEALGDGGYHDRLPGRMRGEVAHARTLDRKPSHPGPPIDLHWSFHGIRAPTARACEVLCRDPDTLSLGGVGVRIPRAAARSLIVALHASAGGDSSSAIEDLARALAILDAEDWRRAYELAGELDAVPSFLLGLETLPAGRALARTNRWGAPSTDVDASIRATGRGEVALTTQRLLAAESWRARLAILGREILPSGEFMAIWAGRELSGPRLGLAHLHRWSWIARKAPGAISVLTRSRRESR